MQMSIATCRFCLRLYEGAEPLCRERKKERDAELRQVLEGQTARMVELLDNHQKLQVCCFLLLCEEEEGFYKFLPANTANCLCQSWQSCSNHHDSSSIWYVMTPLCCHTSCWIDSRLPLDHQGFCSMRT